MKRVPVLATTSLETNGKDSVRVRAHTRPRNAWFFRPRGGAAFGQATFTFIQQRGPCQRR